MTFFVKVLDVGNYMYATNDPNDNTFVADGVYPINGWSVTVVDGLITKMVNQTTGEIRTYTEDQEIPIFGGDTFINRFSFKRKHSMFNNTSFELPDQTDINYSLLGNVAYPVYYFDTIPKKKPRYLASLTGLNFPLTTFSDNIMNRLFPIWGDYLFDTENFINKPKYLFDCSLEDSQGLVRELDNEVSFTSASGLMYTYFYGIPSYIGESDINVDLRDIGVDAREDFYPHQADLSYWLQEEVVPPITDNFYKYDNSYSKQPFEEFNFVNDITFKGTKSCKVDRSNRVIYTSQAGTLDDSAFADNFLVNRALDYYDFSKKNGKIIDLAGIEGDKVLVRQENASSVFGAYIEINTNQDTALISSGSIFNNKPVQFSKPSLGYFGSQHRAILHTQFGHVSVDAKRGQVFLLGNGGQNLEEISNKGMKHWFKENLPFTLGKYFPKLDIDNTFAGVGIALGFDNLFNSFYLTKLDYEPLSDDVAYSASLKRFYLKSTGKEISLGNKRYFCDKSWTISYNFYMQAWQSFHSFKPKLYLDHIEHFDTIVDSGIWSHNVTNKSYQKYYGKLYPFIVETITSNDWKNHVVQNVNYLVDVNQYVNEVDRIPILDIGFNRAMVYNETQNSGILELDIVGDNLFLFNKYPVLELDRTRIPLSMKHDYHTFNQFKDLVKNSRVPTWVHECNNIDNRLNDTNFKYKEHIQNVSKIKGLQNRVRLIQDKESKYHMIHKGTFINEIPRQTL